MNAARTSKWAAWNLESPVSNLEWDTLDAGRLVINREFASLFRSQNLSTFDQIWQFTAQAAVAKNVRSDRVTLRFTLNESGRDRVFYIKRHGRSSLKEYLKPLFSLRWPILGARNEWEALIAFHRAQIPTMVPVALGQRGSQSFLVTEGLERCTKLSALDQSERDAPAPVAGLDRQRLIRTLARLTRQMHAAGLHHQDYYLGHLLLPEEAAKGLEPPDRLYVIDLGRVCQRARLATRWIVKDLAQLNYSASGVSVRDRLRFLREYLGHPVGPADRVLLTRIESKTAAIARHSRKNRL